MEYQQPRVGAAISLLDLPRLKPWLLEGMRDLELQDFCFASILDGDWQGLAAQAKRMLDGFAGRLGIHGPFRGFEMDARDPDIQAVVARRMDQTVDVAVALDARQIVIHSPYRTWDFHNIDLRPRARDQKIEAAHGCLAAAVKRAETAGVAFVIENIADIDPNDRLVLAQSFGSEAVKLSVDTGHAHFAHTMLGAPPATDFIRSAGRFLGHVHLQDCDGRADRHWAIGAGNIDWAGIFQALDETRANPHLVLELNDSGDIPASMAALKGLAV